MRITTIVMVMRSVQRENRKYFVPLDRTVIRGVELFCEFPAYFEPGLFQNDDQFFINAVIWALSPRLLQCSCPMAVVADTVPPVRLL
jgi:hypothetical protein